MNTNIQVNVTNWPMPARVELLVTIDKLTAEVNDIPAPASPADAPTQPVELPDDIESTGWTLDAYVEVVKRLLSRHSVQAAAIMEAINSGTGYVIRERVYQLGSYPESRSLKGFTRPVNRITADLEDAGKLPEDAEELLRPDYDPDVKGFQRARGFFVPMEVVKLALEAKANSQS